MNITILGTGFAALSAIKQTRKASPNAQITVIGASENFIYYPSLIWVPSGMRTGDDLKINLHNFFNRKKVQFIEARVENVINGGRTVVTTQGEFENDGLIIATGGRFIKKLPGIEHAITPCEGIDAAKQIKERLETMTGGTIAIGFGGNPKEPSAMRGGPMFEFVFGIDTLLRRQGRRDQFKIIFFSPAPEPGKRLGPKVPGKLVQLMHERGIETRLGNKMVGLEENLVKTEAEVFEADLILFTIDASRGWTPADDDIYQQIKGLNLILVINKSDLGDPQGVKTPEEISTVVNTAVAINQGIDALETAIIETIEAGKTIAQDLDIAINKRQAGALTRAKIALNQVQETILNQLPLDFWTIDLRSAIQALGEITGEEVTESVLDRIFSRFCIGK